MQNNAKTIAIIGATSAIAEQCARLWLAQGPVARLVLVGRDAPRLQSLAADLRIRQPGAAIEVEVGDLASPPAIADLVQRICTRAVPDTVLVAYGTLPDQTHCQADLEQASAAMHINGVAPTLFAEAFSARMQARGHGSIGIIGSVAGDRGRKSNYIYGAAKGLLERYAQGLQHRLAGSGVRVTLIKPGPTDTPMTAHLKAQGARLASTEQVALAIVRGMAQGKPVVYAPFQWALIMLVIRSLPRAVFHKMNI